ISFPPTALKFLQVNFQTNYGGLAFQASKLEVYEAVPEKSIVADVAINLAAPAAGGAVVRFSSPQTNLTQLFDGQVSNDGWMTLDNNLPTEMVLAFRGDRAALIDRVVLNPQSKRPKESWPRRVSISVSAEHPLDGFEEIGIFAIEPEPREQEFRVRRRGRFVKLRILENQGGTNASLGEFKVIEGRADDYRSLLMTPIRAFASSSKGEANTNALAAVAVGIPEAEPNNRSVQAVDLVSGKTMRGSIDPRSDEDYFSFKVPGPGAEVMTLELDGHPNVRTSVSLLSEAGSELKRFDPARPPAQQARLSWRVEPGRYFLRIYEPPSSIVVVWDSSSSMSGREKKLQTAIETYISRVRPSERLQLVQFSRNTAALLPDFTSDPGKLQAAIKSKFKLSGGTSFFDAMTNAMTLLDKVEGNRAIIVMTDGADSSSRLSYPAFWKQIEEKRIRIYSIGLGGNLNQSSGRTGASPRRTLKHISMATDGWEFFTEDPEELGVLYDIIADDLRSEAKYAFTPRFGLGRGALQVSAGSIDRISPKTSVVELIFDASGSMREKIEGRRKIEIAKEVMSQTIDGLPPERQVALRLFGHRMASQKIEARFDSELVVPAQLLDRALLKERINRLQPVGTTPIAYSLSQVTNDLSSFSGDRAVVLVTDGREEAGGDPEGVLQQLQKQGFKVRLIIVGFGLKPEVREDVRRLAENYGGHFFDANTTTELRQAIQHAVLEIPMTLPFKVVDSDGIMLSEGTTGKGELKVPAGVYSVLMDAPGKEIAVPNVRVSPDARSKVFVRKEGAQYTVQVQGP
ncbi:MAG TPA: VWA domain-containing protein, partial [Candidatus Limnocylindria bacterium]|nr:VWA domain-containing protein [Candidatus Limnocylindria bacterium]